MSRPSRRRTLAGALLVTAAGGLLSSCEPAPEPESDGQAVPAADTADVGENPRFVSYAIVRGPDTLAVERVLRSAGRLGVEIEGPADHGMVLFEATTGADGLVRSITLEPREAGAGSRAAARSTVHFEGGLAVSEVPDGDSIRTDSLDVPEGTLPWLTRSVALVEQIVRRARAMEGDTVTVPVLRLGETSSPVRNASVHFDSPTSATVRIEPDEEIRLTLDAGGRVVRMESVRDGVVATRTE